MEAVNTPQDKSLLSSSHIITLGTSKFLYSKVKNKNVSTFRNIRKNQCSVC